MPTYKLYYFNTRGRAELTRWIFAQAGVPYEDIRVEKDKWPEVKPTMPFGTMPVMDMDGKRLSGSVVIARYLAEAYGLAGSNALENAEVASVVDAVNDLTREMLQVFFEKDENKKEELHRDFSEKTLPTALEKFNQLALASERGYLWGSKLTWADFSMVIVLTYITALQPEILDNFPALKKLKETVESLPNIAKWINERPVTNY